MGDLARERPHGYARYRLGGCRCYVCARAVSRYEQDRQKQITAGTWRPFADAGPVREHLADLARQGVGYKRAAALAGVGHTTVASLLFGRRGNPPGPRVRREVAERLLAVRPVPAAHAVVDGTGTARRVQALCCLGWTLTAQAARIGWTVQNYTRLTAGVPVIAATARLVADLYDRLSATPAPAGASASRARAMATRRRWVPPLAWDDEDLDNPRARPRIRRPAAELVVSTAHRRPR